MIEAKFYETYYFYNIVRNLLFDQFSYLSTLNEFYGDGESIYLIKPFEKYSAFHRFIEFVVRDIYHEENLKIDLEENTLLARNYADIPSALKDIKPMSLPIELAFDFHGIEYEKYTEFLSENTGTGNVVGEWE